VNTNKDLFWQLLEAYHPKAEAFCRRLTGNLADGDDLYHDAILLAWRKFDSLREHDSFKPWLYRIIVNIHKGQMRGIWRRLFRPLAEQETEVLPFSDPTNQLAARILVQKALRQLSAKDRALIILFEIEGWSIGELANLEGKPEGTIKSRLARTRAAMRNMIMGTVSFNINIQSEEEAKYVAPETKPGI
jgi:RNA polymerase sigma-70 factor (ECF subfamily)